MVLGCGLYSKEGGIVMIPLIKQPRSQTSMTSTDTEPDSPFTSTNGITSSLDGGSPPSSQRFLRQSSSFLRVADLGIGDSFVASSSAKALRSPSSPSADDTCSLDSGLTGASSDASFNLASPPSSPVSRSHKKSSHKHIANFSCPSVDPPPGVDHDPLEQWVALDDGAGQHAPIAPLAVQALAKTGLEAALDQSMWTPHSSSKHFKAAPWHTATWPPATTIPNNSSHSDAGLPPAGGKHEDMVVLWMGKFQHGLYGSELPAVRATGIIPAPPKVLFDLLIDSDRVKEYNKLSLGREDLLVLQDSLHQDGPFGRSVTKVMRSQSSPPLVPKAMQFISMLHATELEDGSGYLIVTRAVHHPDDNQNDTSVLRSEILLGINIIRRIEGDPNRCVMINMIHMRSPMVPMIIATRIGATAAGNFIRDLRSAFTS